MKNLAALFAALLIMFFAGLAPPALAATTVLKVYNASNEDVDVWFNCENPFANNITVKDDAGKVYPVRIPSIFTRGEKGVFTLPRGVTVALSRKSGGNTFSGTITFNSIPVCPCGGAGQPPCPQVGAGFNLPTKLVNGVNQGEFTLNPPSLFESVDISCVNGSMCKMEMLVAGGSPNWKNPATMQPVARIKNGIVDVAARIDENCAEVGVFPFNATDCIRTPLPPCGQPICFHKQKDCQLDRRGGGGTVTLVIKGFDAL